MTQLTPVALAKYSLLVALHSFEIARLVGGRIKQTLVYMGVTCAAHQLVRVRIVPLLGDCRPAQGMKSKAGIVDP